MCKMVFDDKIDRKYYCDNCMYNSIKIGQILNFEAYNVTAKLGIIYACRKKTTLIFSFIMSAKDCLPQIKQEFHKL